MQCHVCNGRLVYTNSTQEAAKNDSKFSSSCDLVDVDVSMNKRGKMEEE